MNTETQNMNVDDTLYETTFTKKFLQRKPYEKADPGKMHAHIPGIIKKIFVYEGKRAKKGENMMILEAMKMENTICAPADIVVKKLYIKEGDIVVKNQILIEVDFI